MTAPPSWGVTASSDAAKSDAPERTGQQGRHRSGEGVPLGPCGRPALAARRPNPET